MTRKPLAILSLSAAAVGGALLSAGVASAAPVPTAAIASAPTTYTVQPGDSLWAIGQRFGISMQDLAAANGMNLSDILYAGRTLTISAQATPAPTAPAPAAPPTAASSTSAPSTSATSSSGAVSPSSSLERCIIGSESGGDAQVTNSSGHYGLYQFSKSTWEAYGGSASDFGHASPAEQQRVFDTAIADGGASNWTAYDGC